MRHIIRRAALRIIINSALALVLYASGYTLLLCVPVVLCGMDLVVLAVNVFIVDGRSGVNDE